MNARTSTLLGIAATAVLAACTPKVIRVEMDTARVVAPSTLKLACPYRLEQITDARPEGDQAGGLGLRAFHFADAVGVMRRQLGPAGFVDDAPTPVRIRLVQLYLAQSHVTKIPVAVYQMTVGEEAPVVLRSQKASMNWNGTENEAYAAYALAIADVNRQMIQALNLRCSRS